MRFRWGGQYPGVNTQQITNVLILSGRLVIFRNLALSLAGRTVSSLYPAEVLPLLKCIILTLGISEPLFPRHLNLSPCMDIEHLVRLKTSSLAVRTSHHAD